MAEPEIDRCGVYDIYFDTKDRGIDAPGYKTLELPPENLLQNPGFEEEKDGLPAGWKIGASPRRIRQSSTKWRNDSYDDLPRPSRTTIPGRRPWKAIVRQTAKPYARRLNRTPDG